MATLLVIAPFFVMPTVSAFNSVYRLVFESGRPVLGETIHRIASCGRSDHGAWMAYPKAAHPRINLWRREVGARFLTGGATIRPLADGRRDILTPAQ